MRDAELLAFNGYDDLAARLLPGADDGMPKGKVALHAAMDQAGGTVLFVETGAKITAPQGVTKIEARIDEKTGLVALKTKAGTPAWKIVSTESVDSLAKAMKPVVRGEPLREVPSGHLLAWCADGGVFSRLVRECLSLGCDRIRWAGLSARGAGAVVARIEDPPWF